MVIKEDTSFYALGLAPAPIPAALFQGYNSVFGNGLSTAVTGDSVMDGASSEIRCSVCETVEELARSIEVDQSLSVSFGPFGGSQKMHFMNSLRVTTHSVAITVYARHTTGKRTVTDARLRDGIFPPKSKSELDGFVSLYGDAFLSGFSEGGEYYAVYSFYSQTREEQKDLVAKMGAHGIFSGVTVGAELQTAMSNFLKANTTRYSFRQQASGIRNPVLPLPSDFVDYAVKYPSLVLDAPVRMGMEFTGYEAVRGVGTAFKAVAKNRDFFVGDSIISGLTEKLVTVNQIANQIAWVRATYDTYGGYRDHALEENERIAKRDIDTVHALMTTYEHNPTGHFVAPDLESLDNGAPILQYRIHHSPAWGGEGGVPFEDVDERTFMQSHPRIVAIKLRSGGRVDQLSTTYQGGAHSWTSTHGGTGGREGNTLQIPEGQSVVRIDGRAGGRVDQINLTLSDGRSVGGGAGGGAPFSWQLPDGHFVLGFRGRSGSELDKLQVVYAEFQPAKWQPAGESEA